MDYITDTGHAAGRIFEHLADVGEAKLSDVKRIVGLKNFDYAIGWLLRENKIRMEPRGRSVFIRLN